MQRNPLVVLSLFLCLIIAVPAQAATYDYFLKLDGIDGEGTSRGHEKWIDVSAYGFGASVITSGGGGTTSGRPAFDDFSFTKLLDSATPQIFEAVVLGNPIASARFDIVKNGERPSTVFSYSFTDVMLSSVHDSGAEPGLPGETASFSFGSIKVQSYLQDPKGTPVPGPSFQYELEQPIQTARLASFDATVASVPEPATWATLVAGLVLLCGVRRRLPNAR